MTLPTLFYKEPQNSCWQVDSRRIGSGKLLTATYQPDPRYAVKYLNLNWKWQTNPSLGLQFNKTEVATLEATFNNDRPNNLYSEKIAFTAVDESGDEPALVKGYYDKHGVLSISNEHMSKTVEEKNRPYMINAADLPQFIDFEKTTDAIIGIAVNGFPESDYRFRQHVNDIFIAK